MGRAGYYAANCSCRVIARKGGGPGSTVYYHAIENRVTPSCRNGSDIFRTCVGCQRNDKRKARNQCGNVIRQLQRIGFIQGYLRQPRAR